MELKQSLNSEFALIHDLCLFVLNNSQKADLVRATLATLAAYLTWVPLGYVLESNIAELLLKLFPPAPTRNLALQCLTEVCPFPAFSFVCSVHVWVLLLRSVSGCCVLGCWVVCRGFSAAGLPPSAAMQHPKPCTCAPHPEC